jgi:uncharacterized Ntn-hydrolase superfamily protein
MEIPMTSVALHHQPKESAMSCNRATQHHPHWARICIVAFALLFAVTTEAEPNDATAQDYIATFSIVARDPTTGDLGIGVQSKYFAVGSVVPHARAAVGVVATQARGNILYGPEGLDLLAAGHPPEQVLEQLLQDDPLREERQVGIIDAQGRTVSYTGSKALAWAGGSTGKDYAVQGNLLAGPEVVDAMAAAFETAQGDLASRLVMALAAGQAAGGDRRGRQSAAILVVRAGGGYMGVSDRYVDLHVEDHPAPIRELRRLLDIRLAQLAVEQCRKVLNEIRKLPAGSDRDQAAVLARARAEQALRLHNQSYAAWLALAEAHLWSGDRRGAAAAAQRALILNPTLKRYANRPESGLGPDPEVLKRLLTIDAFRRLWDALPPAEATP